MTVKFPQYLNKANFVLGLILCYMVSCFDMADLLGETTINFSLFLNDFRELGTLAWLVSAIQISVFIGIISFGACVLSKERLYKSIFFAIHIDSYFSVIHSVVFSYHENVYSLIVRNGFTALALLFAYFILFNDDKH